MESGLESPSIETVSKMCSVFFGNRSQEKEGIIKALSEGARDDTIRDLLVKLGEKGVGMNTKGILNHLEKVSCDKIAGNNREEAIRLKGLCIDRDRWQTRLSQSRELGLDKVLAGLSVPQAETVLGYLNAQLIEVDLKTSSAIAKHADDPKFFIAKLLLSSNL